MTVTATSAATSPQAVSFAQAYLNRAHVVMQVRHEATAAFWRLYVDSSTTSGYVATLDSITVNVADPARWLASFEKTAKPSPAQRRAKRLLVDHLDRRQRQQLKARGYFEVEVGGKLYRIREGTHGNVRRVESGVEVESFCIQPAGVPVHDSMLAQLMMLEANEAEFLRIANARRLVR